MKLLRVQSLCRSGFIREASATALTILQGHNRSSPNIHLGHKPETTGRALFNPSLKYTHKKTRR
jgi:hypothetical protein